MESKIIDLVSDNETDTALTPVVDTVSKVPTQSAEVQNVVVDLVSTSDKDSVKNEANVPSVVDADSEIDLVSCSEVDSDFLQIKPEERRNKIEVTSIIAADFVINKRQKTNGNKYVRRLRRSKGFLKQIMLELEMEDSEGDYEGDVDVGPLDDEDYDIGPVIQTA